MTKYIPLTQGKFASVDDEDFEFLMNWEWYAFKNEKENTWYAGRNVGKSPHQKRMSMHRFIMGVDNPSVLVDHKDRNGLNNQKHNLRRATKSQNRANSKKRTNNTSGFIGVVWRSDSNSWKAQIIVGGKHISKSGFKFPEDAARFYNQMAIKYFGEFATINEGL